MPARPPLLSDEHVLVDIRPHGAFLSAPLLVALVAVAVGITLDVAVPHTSVSLHWVEGTIVAVPCAWLAARFVRWRSCWLMLTTDRLVDQWGAAPGNHVDIPLDSIQRVTAVQSPVRRLLGTGAVDVAVWGHGVLHRVEDARHPTVLVRIITRRLHLRPENGPED
jgi:uncharacterized membrane protein YdbT with pleckstrin-like domain